MSRLEHELAFCVFFFGQRLEGWAPTLLGRGGGGRGDVAKNVISRLYIQFLQVDTQGESQLIRYLPVMLDRYCVCVCRPMKSTIPL